MQFVNMLRENWSLLLKFLPVEYNERESNCWQRRIQPKRDNVILLLADYEKSKPISYKPSDIKQ